MRIRTRILAVSAIAGIALGMTACSAAPNPGTAVESLGVTYTENDVTVAADELGQVLGQQLSRENVVSVLAIAQPYLQLGEQAGISADAPEIAGMRDEILAETGTDPASLHQTTNDVLSTMLVSQMLSMQVESAQLLGELTELASPPNTIVNPRYGQFSPEAGLTPPGPLADVVQIEPDLAP